MSTALRTIVVPASEMPFFWNSEEMNFHDLKNNYEKIDHYIRSRNPKNYSQWCEWIRLRSLQRDQYTAMQQYLETYAEMIGVHYYFVEENKQNIEILDQNSGKPDFYLSDEGKYVEVTSCLAAPFFRNYSEARKLARDNIGNINKLGFFEGNTDDPRDILVKKIARIVEDKKGQHKNKIREEQIELVIVCFTSFHFFRMIIPSLLHVIPQKNYSREFGHPYFSKITLILGNHYKHRESLRQNITFSYLIK